MRRLGSVGSRVSRYALPRRLTTPPGSVCTNGKLGRDDELVQGAVYRATRSLAA